MSSVSPLLPAGLHAGSSAAAGSGSGSIGHQLTNNDNSLFLNNLANSNRAGDAGHPSTANGHHTLNTLNSLNSLNTLNTLNTLNSLNNNLNNNLNHSLENGPAQFANGEAASNPDSSASLSNHLTGNTVPTSYFPFPTTGDQASVYSAAAASSLAGNSNSQQCRNWDVALKQSSADYGANSSYLLNNKLSFQQLSSNGSSYAGSAAFNSNGAITSAAAAAAASNSVAANSTYFCLDSAASTFPLSGVTNGSSATHLNNLNNLNQLNLNSNSAQHLDSLGNHLFNPINPMMHHHSNHQPHSSLNNSLQNSLQNNLHGGGLPNSAVPFDYFTGLNMNQQSNSNLQANGSGSDQPASSLESTNGSNNLLADQKSRIEHVE